MTLIGRARTVAANIAVVSLREQTPPESIVHLGRLGSHQVMGADARFAFLGYKLTRQARRLNWIG